MVVDPRTFIRSLFTSGAGCKVNSANITIEDGSLANFYASYEMSEDNIKELFTDREIDVLFVVRKGDNWEKPLETDSGPIGYYFTIGVQPAAVDKEVLGVQTVSGTKLNEMALAEARRVVRENPMAGSVTIAANETREIERAGTTLIYGDTLWVTYLKWVQAYSVTASTLGSRGFPTFITEIRCGTASGSYSSICEASGLGVIDIEENTPDIKITIPGAANAVTQEVSNPDVKATVTTWDYWGAYQLLYATNVSGTSKAIASTGSRTTIGYFAIEHAYTKINNSTDIRTPSTCLLIFVNARIGNVNRHLAGIGSTFTFEVSADSITQVDV